jgi:cobalt-zinc-cadmium efflux system outer membrane protein
MQQDVLQAQVNRTKIVKEITMHHQQMGQVQAHLKGLLSRDQGSPDVVTEDLVETPLKRTSNQLLAFVRQNNPQIQVDPSSIRKQDAQLASAKREGKPDLKSATCTRTPIANTGTITCSHLVCAFLARRG